MVTDTGQTMELGVSWFTGAAVLRCTESDCTYTVCYWDEGDDFSHNCSEYGLV